MKSTRLFLFFAIAQLLTSATSFGHSAVLNKEYVDTLVAPYLEMQEALANDDLEATQKGNEQLLQAIKDGPSVRKARSLAPIRKHSKAIAKAKDLKKARALFSYLSKEMILMVEHVGTTASTDLFEVRCGMAFNNNGADWIQATKDVKNPYYGSTMLKCGVIKRHLIEKGKADEHQPHID